MKETVGRIEGMGIWYNSLTEANFRVRQLYLPLRHLRIGTNE